MFKKPYGQKPFNYNVKLKIEMRLKKKKKMSDQIIFGKRANYETLLLDPTLF